MARLFSLRLAGVAVVASCLAALAAPPVFADEILFLRDGRKIPVKRLARRVGQVVFETLSGETFSVPEDQVVSPPLARIPFEDALFLVLRDGRRIPVTELKREGGLVLFETTRGERFSVAEDQVAQPPLESIESLDAPFRRTPPVAAPPARAPSALPPPPVAPAPPAAAAPAFATVVSPLPDRWSIPFPDDPRITRGGWTDPYQTNTLKGDKPVLGDSVFLALAAAVDLPVDIMGSPAGPGVVSASPDSSDLGQETPRLVAVPRVGLAAELFQGAAGYRPRSWAIRASGVLAFRGVRAGGRTTDTTAVGLQEAYGEAKLLTVSREFDFVSVRAGIQPFVSDVRGFVLNDLPAGARLFGTFGGNRVQWNAAWLELLRKQRETRVNELELAAREVVVGNLVIRDVTPGYRLGASYHLLREDGVSPTTDKARVQYAGLTGDGRLGGFGITHAVHYAWGEGRAGDRPIDVASWMGALEVWRPREWVRYRASLFFAGGDEDAADGKAGGFDAIQDLPSFAGGSLGFWTRSGIALPGAGVMLKPADSLLPSLRSGKFARSSYVNPGLLLAGLGAEMDLTPKLRATLLSNYLRFHRTSSLETLLGLPSVRPEIGVEVGAGLRYRPFLNEQAAISTGFAVLVPGQGWKDLEPALCAEPGCAGQGRPWNAFLRLELAY